MATLISRITHVCIIAFCFTLLSTALFAQISTPVKGLLPADATFEEVAKPGETSGGAGMMRAVVPFALGDVFAAVGNGRIQHYSENGVLLEVLDTGLGGFTTGMASDDAGNLFVTNFSASSVSRFSGPESPHNRTLFTGVDINSQPESILFDDDGNVFVGQANDPRDILKFDAAGNLLARYDVAFSTRGADWIDLAADQSTMYYTSEGKEIFRYDVSTGQQLPSFATGLPGTIAFALRLLPGGGLLVADSETILRLDENGTIIQTYDAPGEDRWFALNLAPDGTSFWSGDFNTSNFYRFDINSGQQLLGPINTGTGFSTFFGLSVFGELTVSNNQPPVCTVDPPGPFSILEGEVLNFVVSGSDPDPGDVLLMEGQAIPATAIMSPALPFSGGSGMNSQFTWTPGYGEEGSYQLTYIVSDSSGDADTTLVDISVTALQRAPECLITPSGPFVLNTGQTLSFTVSGSDSNQADQIVLNTGGLPAGAVMNPSLPALGVGSVSSDFGWTPAAGQEGSYFVDFTVTDATGRSSLCTVSIAVNAPPPNDPPVCSIDPPGPFDIQAGENLMFMVMGSDLNPGDVVTLASGDLPAGALMDPVLPVSGVNSVNALFNWTPAEGQEGNYTLTYTATDTAGLSGTATVAITVSSPPPVNLPPVCLANPAGPFTVTVGDPLSFEVTGSDPNPGDVVTLASGDLPAGALMDPVLPVSGVNSVNALFSWTPAEGQEGSYSLSYTATDTSGLADTCVVAIVVEAAPADNLPPVCLADPAGPFTVTVGDPLSFEVTGSDPNPGDVVTLASGTLPAGALMDPVLPVSGVNSVNALFSWTPVVGQEGSYSLSYTATDTSGLADTCVVTIVVEPAVVQTDSLAPFCQLTGNNPGPPETIEVTIQDAQSGLSHVNILQSSNATIAVPAFTPGSTDPVIIIATKIDGSESATVMLEVVDMAGNATICDPVYHTVSAVVPEGHTLSQNYPNPFNPTTRIRFDIPAAALGAVAVTVRIYDIRGRLVRSLMDEGLQPGQYEVLWDGKNSYGEVVAGGLYFYRLVAGDYTATRKMIFMK